MSEPGQSQRMRRINAIIKTLGEGQPCTNVRVKPKNSLL